MQVPCSLSRRVLLSSIPCAASRRVSSQEKSESKTKSLQQKIASSFKNLLTEESKIHTHIPSYKTQSWSSIQINAVTKASGTKYRAQKDCVRGLYKTVQIHFTGKGWWEGSDFSRKS